MRPVARGIVRHRKLVLILAVVLLIPALLGTVATRINYDILTYLPPELDSMIGEVALENDFNLASTGMITVEGIPYFTGTQLPFIASIVIGTVQLGATVDYAILMSTRFKEERNLGHTPKESAQIACQYCSQSILSSGLTFFAATIGVAAISRMELLKSICLLISRGALISMFVIIFILPCLLMLLDPVIKWTTLHWIKKKPEEPEKPNHEIDYRRKHPYEINPTYRRRKPVRPVSCRHVLTCPGS